MCSSLALRERGRLAVLLGSLVHTVGRRGEGTPPDPRNLRTWRQFVLGVLVQRSTHLITVAQAVAPLRHTTRVKSAAAALGYLLREAQWALRPYTTRLLQAAVEQLDPALWVTYCGSVLIVIDPTEYPKRSRGTGKRGRQMQHIGRVRQAAKGLPKRGVRRGRGKPPAEAGRAAPPPTRRVTTTYGYVDVWAGLVLRGQQFFPLGRLLYSNRHPKLQSQNRVEEAVLGLVRGVVRRLGWRAIVIGDRGLGRKELLIRLAHADQAYVFRVDPDILVGTPGAPPSERLDAYLARQPVLGRARWQRGSEPALDCTVRAATATIRYSRTGRRAEYTEATLQFVEWRPEAPGHDPLVLATTLPVTTLQQAVGIAWVYGQRWSVETAFEVMKGWGLDQFMVRAWEAVDRLLSIVAVAYALLLLALRTPRLGRLRTQAIRLLKAQAVLGRRLTPGKLAEAIGLDFPHHRRAWAQVWRC
jgi:hypothetical protein